ncbi:NAD(P)-binding protein [Aspergillus ibericus CBS 121593]|uniref:NAD(P)-binding protein n=1 Tax=Aspergillus ibericus CBS 121593 TaxID=1448316 RepID=A0A395H7Y9_9EURO|nr:NAD(P)-binding protein [Aspergillus ibericus CBS 121593]RAL02998.1 NAD(P)-binding protein [Aspergillus ibericus CBS 121593]
MKIALLGPTGQVGQSSHPDPNPQPLTTAESFTPEQQARLTTKSLDLVNCSTDDLIPILTNIDIVISALNGPALAAQSKVQDAAATTGVKRFYPSEYGMHHVYQPPGEEYGLIHPTWMSKITSTEPCLHHPSITSGQMTYTLICSGDLYNQPRETTWCPWTNPTLSSYTLYIVGNPDAKIDFTHTDDLAAFIVETIRHPELSENKELNFVNDTVSYAEIADMLERFSGREVKKVVYPMEVLDQVMRDKGSVPEEVRAGGSFADDFWILVRGMQGQGSFVRPKGMVHNGVFGGVGVKRVEGYLEGLFGGCK